MSSFVGHIAAGTAVYLTHHRLDDRQARWALPVLVLLALSPDIDYLPHWVLNLHPSVRFTHSVLFCLAMSALAWAACTPLRWRHPQALTPWMVLSASLSHLLLDTLVGAHPEPLLWPFTATEVLWPLGLLPSAGHLHWGNVYLWRNLLIECGVLWPLLAVAVAGARRSLTRHPMAWGVGLPAWGACLAWSLAIH